RPAFLRAVSGELQCLLDRIGIGWLQFQRRSLGLTPPHDRCAGIDAHVLVPIVELMLDALLITPCLFSHRRCSKVIHLVVREGLSISEHLITLYDVASTNAAVLH